MALSHRLAPLALLLAGAEGFRKKLAPDLQNASSSLLHRQNASSSLKFIAGVPVHNYHLVHDGFSSLSQLETETEQEWVLVVNPETSDEDITHMCEAGKNSCNRAGHPSKGGVPFIELTATEEDLVKVIEASHGLVRYAEPDTEVQLIPEFAEPLDAGTWGLERIGANHQSLTGAGATVFVVDTGVRVSHQEFNGRAVPALDMTVGEPLECNGDISCAVDRQGHGTHCAATAAGVTYGVAPEADVKSIKVLSDTGAGSWSWTYAALDWITQNPSRPSVASMSLGGSGTQTAMKDAVDAAVNMGVVVVVASGNFNSDACHFSPAYVPSAITVGSITNTDARSSFSNFGSCTDIWAPGSNIVSASHTSDAASQTLSGTSMACPHVSGAAALFLEANPFFMPWTVEAEMIKNASVGFVTGLNSHDTNLLLFIGEDGPPILAVTPKNCPWWTFGLC